MEEIENGNLIGSVNGTVVGNAALVVGKKGLALYTDGVNQYVDFGYQGDTCLGSISLCAYGWVTAFWVRPVDDSSGTIMDSRTYAYERVVIFVHNFILQAYLSSPNRQWEVALGLPSRHNWIHIVLTWQPCSDMKLYIDGNLATTRAASSLNPSTNAVPRFVLGANTILRNNYNMTLDELRVWDAVMSDEEVGTLFTVDAGLNWDIP